MIINLPFPPSVNGYWRAHQSRVIISAKGRKYREDALAMIAEQIGSAHVTIECDITVSVKLAPPDRRRRDLDNYQKAAFDAMTHAKVWHDDSQIKRFSVEWSDLVKGGSAEITITPFLA